MDTPLNAEANEDRAGLNVRRAQEAAAHSPERRPVVAALAGAGVAGPIIFTALFILQGVLQPDYSHVALPISALAAFPFGWIQNANFVVFGVLMAAYAVGLHLGVRRTRAGLIGPALLVLSGVGLVVAGSFPWSAADGDFSVPAVHMVGGAFLAFLGAGGGLIAMSPRMAGDPRWRNLAVYALVTGIAIVVLFFAQPVLVIPDRAPLHSWAGVVQRVIVMVWFTCTIILALRLRRVATTADAIT